MHPFGRGLSAVRRTVFTGVKEVAGAPLDSYYVLTKADSRLANSKLHPNTGPPNYDIKHDHKTDLLNVGRYTHDEIDAHIDDDSIHFSDLSNFTTDDLAEGTTNKYYSSALFDSDFSTKTTDDLAEGSTNLYFSGKTTDDLPEGSTNKYYSSALFDADFSTKTTDDLAEGTTNKYYSSALFDADFSAKTTDDLTEGSSNLYFTAERARQSISADSPITYNSSTGVIGLDSTKESNWDTAYAHSQTTTGNPHDLDYADIGLTDKQVIDWTNTTEHIKTQTITEEVNDNHYILFGSHKKTSGTSNETHDFQGAHYYVAMDQADGVVGYMDGIYCYTTLLNGQVGTSTTNRRVSGFMNIVRIAGGTVYGTVYSYRAYTDIKTAGHVTASVFGFRIDVIASGTIDGSAYSLYIKETGSVDYGIYQSGTAPNVFGGTVDAAGYKVSGTAGVDGTFTTADGKTVTVTKGIITSIV